MRDKLCLFWLVAARVRFRMRRLLDRFSSPRRIVATLLAIVFITCYLAFGFTVLQNREPADPGLLSLWFSGGMVIYAAYHIVRCLWTNKVDDLELTSAENLWLGGAPLHSSTLLRYRLTGVAAATGTKTLLLAIVIYQDVASVFGLVAGVFGSLILLDIVRQTVASWSTGLNERQQSIGKGISAFVVAVFVFQVLANLLATTPLGMPPHVYVVKTLHAIGISSQSPIVQMLATPWIPMANLIVAEPFSNAQAFGALGSLLSIALAMKAIGYVNQWSKKQRQNNELASLKSIDSSNPQSRAELGEEARGPFGHELHDHFGTKNSAPGMISDIASLIGRQWLSVQRYRGTISLSFLVPTVLCLSPLALNHFSDRQVDGQWLFIVGGVAFCTMMLAPPALRIDFRRDLRRMPLLKSLPVGSIAMVMGQLTLPILITWMFQMVTLGIAAFVIGPSWEAFLLWSVLLAALAVFTFASENALFLTYPHHSHQQGIAMMIRAKLTFLAKGLVIGLSLGLLVGWSLWCRENLPASACRVMVLGGASFAAWSAAIASVVTAASCWRRFDLSLDMPPQ